MWCRFGGAVWQRAASVGGPAVGLHSTRTVANAGGRPWTREQSFAALPRQHWFPKEDFAIMEDVVTDEEAAVLLKDMDRVLRRRRYEKDHWDAVIVNFREVCLHSFPFLFSSPECAQLRLRFPLITR